MKNKKGQSLKALPALAVILAVTAITIAISTEVTDSVRQNQCSGGYNASSGFCNTGTELGWAYNASMEGIAGLGELAGWQDTIGLIIGASVIIALVIGAFRFAGGGM